MLGHTCRPGNKLCFLPFFLLRSSSTVNTCHATSNCQASTACIVIGCLLTHGSLLETGHRPQTVLKVSSCAMRLLALSGLDSSTRFTHSAHRVLPSYRLSSLNTDLSTLCDSASSLPLTVYLTHSFTKAMGFSQFLGTHTLDTDLLIHHESTTATAVSRSLALGSHAGYVVLGRTLLGRCFSSNTLAPRPMLLNHRLDRPCVLRVCSAFVSA